MKPAPKATNPTTAPAPARQTSRRQASRRQTTRCIRLSHAILGLGLLAALLAASPLRAVVRIELPSDRIRAADLAQAVPQLQNAPAGAVLGYAPLPGIERRVSRHEILEWCEDVGLRPDPAAVPEVVILVRKMRRLPSEQVRELVIESVAERYQVAADQVEVELHSFSEPLLPAEPLDFELASPLNRLGRPTHLTLRWTNTNGRSGNLSFRATAQVRGSYAVARDGIEARAEISAQDFLFKNGALPGEPEAFLLTPEDVEAKQLKQSLKAGQPLERRMIEAAQTVKRGDLLEIHLRSRAIVLRTPARAEQSGATGEVIRCRNLESGTIVRAVIVDARRAEVVSFR